MTADSCDVSVAADGLIYLTMPGSTVDLRSKWCCCAKSGGRSDRPAGRIQTDAPGTFQGTLALPELRTARMLRTQWLCRGRL